MRYRSLLLLSTAVLLLAACGAGYNYNPREIDCSTPPYNSVCAWSSS